MTDDSRLTSAIDLVGLHMHVLRSVVRKGESCIILCHSFILLYIWYQTHGVHGMKIFLHEYGDDASVR